MIDRMPDWAFPVLYFGAAFLIAISLWAEGNGQTAESHRSEVRAAKELLAEQPYIRSPEKLTIIASALDSLDPVAIEEAERNR